MVNLSLFLLSLPLLTQASPLYPRTTFSVCQASCTNGTCATKREPTLSATSEVLKRTLIEIGSDDGNPKFYVADRIKTPGKKVNWDTMRTDATSVYDTFKVTTGDVTDPNSKTYNSDVDNLQGSISGLTGCTGVAVVSEKGYWLAHIMEPAFFNPDKWTKLMDAMRNGWSQTNLLMLPGDTEEKVLQGLQEKGITFTHPSSHTSFLNKANNVQIFISTPSQNAEGVSGGYSAKVAELTSFLTTTFPGATVKATRQYTRPANADAMATNSRFSNYKMLVEYTSNLEDENYEPYTPQKAEYRVWLEDQHYDNAWDVGDDSCPLSPGASPSPKNGARGVGATSTSRGGCQRPTSTSFSSTSTGSFSSTSTGSAISMSTSIVSSSFSGSSLYSGSTVSTSPLPTDSSLSVSSTASVSTLPATSIPTLSSSLATSSIASASSVSTMSLSSASSSAPASSTPIASSTPMVASTPVVSSTPIASSTLVMSSTPIISSTPVVSSTPAVSTPTTPPASSAPPVKSSTPPAAPSSAPPAAPSSKPPTSPSSQPASSKPSKKPCPKGKKIC